MTTQDCHHIAAPGELAPGRAESLAGCHWRTTTPASCSMRAAATYSGSTAADPAVEPAPFDSAYVTSRMPLWIISLAHSQHGYSVT